MKVAPGVHQLKQPIPDNPLEYVNAYLIRGDGENVLIDTGWPAQRSLKALERQLKRIGLGLQDITTVVVTHGHMDHFGLAGEIRRLSGAQIVMHESDAPRIEPREIDAHWFGEQIREWLLTNGIPPEKMAMLQRPFSGSMDFSWLVQPDSTVKGGETLAAGSSHLEVIWTPGHSPGHMVAWIG